LVIAALTIAGLGCMILAAAKFPLDDEGDGRAG
jgi:hypothetical protein